MVRDNGEIMKGNNKNLSNEKNRKSAFTLAEALITIAIIGIVAALTIPNLVKNYQKYQTEVKLKKTYNILSKALQSSVFDNGYVESWTYSNGLDFGQKYIGKYLRVEKYCTDNTGICNFNKTSLNGIKNVYNSSHYPGLSYLQTIVLDDGTQLNFARSWHDLALFVDLNGIKGPNIVGKDVFEFEISTSDDKILSPRYTLFKTVNEAISGSGSYKGSACNKSGVGMSCARAIMLNSWKIPNNYPW